MALTISIEGKGVIANCDALSDTAGGTWSESGQGTLSVSTDSKKFGTVSIGGQYASKAGLQQYDLGAGNELDFTAGTGTESGQSWYVWISVSAMGTLDTLSTYPLCLRLSSDSPGTTNYIDYLIGSNDDANGWDGSWKCFVIDPTKTPSRISGTQSSIIASVRTMGLWIDTSTSARSDAFFIDQMSVGSGLRILGTSTTGWKEVVDYCIDYPNRAWGMMQEKDGVYFEYGINNVGSTAQTAVTSFTDSGRTIQFGKSEYCTNASTGVWGTSLPLGFSGLNIEDHASYTTTFKDGVIVGTTAGRSGSRFLGDASIDIFMDLYGGNNAASITALYGTTLSLLTGILNSGNDANHEFLSVSFIKCAQFDPVGAPLIRNCIFAETQDVDSALLWNENINIQVCNFIANTLGAAIEHPSAAGTPYAYEDLEFSGNTFDGLNSSGTDIVVNKNGTSNPINDEGANTITYSASVALTITVQDEDKAELENAQVSMHLLESPYTVLMNEDTLATGVATDSYAGTTPVQAVLKVRKSEVTDDPRYYGESDIVTIAASVGITRTVTLKVNTFLEGNAADTTAPVYQSSVILDASPSTLTMTYNETLDGGSIPAVGDFAVNDGAVNTVTNVSISGVTVILTLTNAIVFGDTVTVSYTKGTNPIQDTATTPNESINLTTESVTNSVATADIYPQDNVLSITTETNSVGDIFDRVGYGTTSIITTPVKDGTWALKSESTDDTQSFYERIPIGDVTDTETYIIRTWIKSTISTGRSGYCNSYTNLTFTASGGYFLTAMTDYVEDVILAVATATGIGWIQYYPTPGVGGLGNIMELDKCTAQLYTPGEELYPQGDAAGIGEELNSAGKWFGVGSTIGVESVDVDNSTYAIKITSNSTDGADEGRLSLHNLINGQVYTVSWDYKFIANQANPISDYDGWSGFSDFTQGSFTTDGAWHSKSLTLTSNGAVILIRMYVVGDTHNGTGDVLLIDNFSITEN